MTKEKAIEFLQTKSCVHCSYGAISPRDCLVLECELKSAINMAIKALEQQPSEDCVSRKELYNHCFDATIIGKSGKSITRGILLEDEIDGLPPVTPTQSWIPIERRDLTQEEKELYSSLYGDEPEYMIESRMPDDGEEVLVSAGGIVFKDDFSRDDFNFENISIDEIEAWMPLPQPYEEKGGATNDIRTYI